MRENTGIHIGFTGTQQGMTKNQMGQLIAFITGLSERYDIVSANHGDCVGADSEFHDIMSRFSCVLVIHPPFNPTKRAFQSAHIVHAPKTYLARNKEIVKASDIILATPKEHTEQLRSGTWATVRYAKKTKTKLQVFLP